MLNKYSNCQCNFYYFKGGGADPILGNYQSVLSNVGGKKKEIAGLEPIFPPLDVPSSTSPKVEMKPAPSTPSPPLPSTSHFPTPFEQVPPNTTVRMEESAMKTDVLNDTIPTNSENVDPSPVNDKIVVKNEAMIKKELLIEEKQQILAEIETTVSAMCDTINSAEKAGSVCKEAIEKHGVLVEKVLEKVVGDDSDADDGTWKDVFEAANKKADHMQQAQVIFSRNITSVPITDHIPNH